MGHIVLIWGFPFYLIVLEAIFRTISGLDVSSFVGPAIATAGLSFMLPLTRPKTISASVPSELLKVVEESGGVIIDRNDYKFIPFVWIAILGGFLIWFWASITAAESPHAMLLFIPVSVSIGFVNYLVAGMLAMIKQGI